MKIDLTEYPERIKKAKTDIVQTRNDVEKQQRRVEQLETQYKKEAANDDELTNRTKRKAYVSERKEDDEYQEALAELDRREALLQKLEIELEFLQDRFEVAKIYALRGITQLNGTAA